MIYVPSACRSKTIGELITEFARHFYNYRHYWQKSKIIANGKSDRELAHDKNYIYYSEKSNISWELLKGTQKILGSLGIVVEIPDLYEN